MMRFVLTSFMIATFLSVLPIGRSAEAACCSLRKIDAEPPLSQIRVCDPAVDAGCTAWLFEGAFGAGDAQPICVATDRLAYQEWDPDAGAWGPLTEARCDEDTDVEL